MSEQQTHYTVQLINESRNAWTFCIYLAEPDVNVPGVRSLAWLTAMASPTTRVVLSWTLDYGFTWAQAGVLPGGDVTFAASQVWSADLRYRNQVTYTAKNGLPTFANVVEGPNSGSLYIHQDRRVLANRSIVGYSLAGLPASTVPAQPNVDIIITPKQEYWVTFGQFEQGSPLDLSELTNPAQLTFPPNCYSTVARLGEDNLWRVEATDPV